MQFEITSRPKGNDRFPESNMPRRLNFVFSAIKAVILCLLKFLQVSKRADKKWKDYAHRSSMAFFNNPGQITPKWLVWSGQNSNTSEILCLSWLSASLTKIRSIMYMLAWRHHFSIIAYEKFFQCSRAHNTEVNDPIWQEFELIWD